MGTDVLILGCWEAPSLLDYAVAAAACAVFGLGLLGILRRFPPVRSVADRLEPLVAATGAPITVALSIPVLTHLTEPLEFPAALDLPAGRLTRVEGRCASR